MHFNIDLVLYDKVQRKTVCVLDTKYKDQENPSAHDLEQAVAYATAKNCYYAALVYPKSTHLPFVGLVGERVVVKRLSFDIDGDFEKTGQRFMADLLDWMEGL